MIDLKNSLTAYAAANTALMQLASAEFIDEKALALAEVRFESLERDILDHVPKSPGELLDKMQFVWGLILDTADHDPHVGQLLTAITLDVTQLLKYLP
jgi:hypothetical protein